MKHKKKKSKKRDWKKGAVQGVKDVRYKDLGGGIVAVHFDDLPKMYGAKKVPLITT